MATLHIKNGGDSLPIERTPENDYCDVVGLAIRRKREDEVHGKTSAFLLDSGGYVVFAVALHTPHAFYRHPRASLLAPHRVRTWPACPTPMPVRLSCTSISKMFCCPSWPSCSRQDLSMVGAAMGVLTVVGHATDCLLNAVGLAVLLYGRRKVKSDHYN